MRASEKTYAEACHLLRSGKYAEAVTVFTRVIENNSHRAEAYFRRGVCYYLLGNSLMAANDLDAAAVLGCQDAQLWSRNSHPQKGNLTEPLNGLE